MVSFKMTQNNMRRILPMHNGAQMIYNKKVLRLYDPVPALTCQRWVPSPTQRWGKSDEKWLERQCSISKSISTIGKYWDRWKPLDSNPNSHPQTYWVKNISVKLKSVTQSSRPQWRQCEGPPEQPAALQHLLLSRGEDSSLPHSFFSWRIFLSPLLTNLLV